jgi:dipeptidase
MLYPFYPAQGKIDYPRFFGSGSSSSYLPENTENPYGYEFKVSVPMGYIPQVSHTYAYTDAAYGVMNQYQLAIGESTCDARLGLNGVPRLYGGHALFDITALSRVALQRCRTARCAIRTMGELAEEYGGP